MQSLMKINGVWKEGTPYLKEGGTWKEVGGVTARLNGKWAEIKPPAPVFGVRIDINNSSPNDAVEYIDDATGFTPMTRNNPGSWANHPLISGIKPVLHKPDGTWQDLNKRDLQAGITDLAHAGNILTRFPTWWLSITEDTEYQYIRFCQEKLDDTYYKLASYFKGKDQGMFHVGCYHSDGSGSKYLGSKGSASVTEGIDNSHAIGEGFDILSFRHIQYLLSLLIVLFKGRDARTLLGHGSVMPRPDVESTFDNDYGMKGSASSQDHVSFFWLNDFWGVARDWIGGFSIMNGQVGFQDDGEPINWMGSIQLPRIGSCNAVDGFVDKVDMSSTKMAFLPKSANGTDTTYWCTKSKIFTSDLRCGSFGGSRNDPFGPNVMSPFSFNITLAYSPYPSPRGDTSNRIVYRLAVE